MQVQIPASLTNIGRNKCRESGCMCRCLWAKTRSNREKFVKVDSFAALIWESFSGFQNGFKSFYKKKLKGNRGRLHFWQPFLCLFDCSDLLLPAILAGLLLPHVATIAICFTFIAINQLPLAFISELGWFPHRFLQEHISKYQVLQTYPTSFMQAKSTSVLSAFAHLPLNA